MTEGPAAIRPDTKDWTWVLREACPECGAAVGEIPRGDVAPLLRRAVAIWDGVLATGAPELRERPRPQVWSVTEYGCHTRDVFRLFHRRLRLMLDEDDPLYANWDQDATAIEDDYAAQEPVLVAVALRAEGLALADVFDGLDDARWARTGRRSDGASFTCETFGQYLLHDVLHHLWDVGHPMPQS